jgi:ribokinase
MAGKTVMEKTLPKVVVVGSLNIDYTLRVPRIPAPGETLTARSMFSCLGGKGANQAIAAARAGARAALIGCVGEDESGTRYIEALKKEGIDTRGMQRSSTPTGVAFIVVDDAGENSIIVNLGANHEVTKAQVERHAALIREADALLLQLECPLPVVRLAAEIARAAGVRVILNPSPLTEAFLADPFEVDVLIVNEGEAQKMAPNRSLQEANCRQLVITRGAESTLHVTEGGLVEYVPPGVLPVDTVGAGDAFAGAFAVASSEGQAHAVRFANAAGALATQKAGAQPSIPWREAIVLALRGQD